MPARGHIAVFQTPFLLVLVHLGIHLHGIPCFAQIGAQFVYPLCQLTHDVLAVFLRGPFPGWRCGQSFRRALRPCAVISFGNPLFGIIPHYPGKCLKPLARDKELVAVTAGTRRIIARREIPVFERPLMQVVFDCPQYAVMLAPQHSRQFP